MLPPAAISLIHPSTTNRKQPFVTPVDVVMMTGDCGGVESIAAMALRGARGFSLVGQLVKLRSSLFGNAIQTKT